MRVVAKSDQIQLDDDPKPRDRATWQRLRVLIEEEACHPDWGCALYRLHRTGRISNEQREAGDRYAALVRDHRKLWVDHMGSIEIYMEKEDYAPQRRTKGTQEVVEIMGRVVAEGLREESEFEVKRAQRIGRRYKEAAAVAGTARNILEELLIDEIWPTSEKNHLAIAYALERLAHFFYTGTKRKPNI